MLTPYATPSPVAYQPLLYSPYTTHSPAPLNEGNLWPMANGRSIHPGEELYDRIGRQGLLNFIFESNEYQPLSYYIKQAALAPFNMAKNTVGFAINYFKNKVLSIDQQELLDKTAIVPLEACKFNGSSELSLLNYYGEPPSPELARLISWEVTLSKYTDSGSSKTDDRICQNLNEVMNQNFNAPEESWLFTESECCNVYYPPVPDNFMVQTFHVAGQDHFLKFNYSIKVNFSSNETLNYLVGNISLESMYNDFFWHQEVYYYGQINQYYVRAVGTLSEALSYCVTSVYKKKYKVILSTAITIPSVSLIYLIFLLRKKIIARYKKYLLNKKLKEIEKETRIRMAFQAAWPLKKRDTLLYQLARKIRHHPVLLKQLCASEIIPQDLKEKILAIPCDQHITLLLKGIAYDSLSCSFAAERIEIVIDKPTERTPLLGNSQELL